MLAKAKKKLWLFPVLIILIYIATDTMGICIKSSDDGKLYAIALPATISLDLLGGIHQVEIFVIGRENDGLKQEYISLEQRRNLRGVYWEAGKHNLWVDGDGGALCYQETETGWDEYALVKNESGIVLVYTSNTKKCIEIDCRQVPIQIRKRYLKTLNYDV